MHPTPNYIYATVDGSCMVLIVESYIFGNKRIYLKFVVMKTYLVSF